MNVYKKVLFISTSDTGMGPMAEGILKKIIWNTSIRAGSRGLVVLFSEPVNQKAEAVLISKGISVEGHMSVALNEEDFAEETLILTMSQAQKEKVHELFGSDRRVFTLLEFLGKEGEITNPYGGSLSDYGQCYESLYVLLTELVKKIGIAGGTRE